MPMVDAYWHHLWAIDIAKGDFIGKEVFFRAPLYPYFLGIIYSIFGVNFIIPRIIQIIIGSINCVLIYKLACRLFNNKVGFIAAAISIFYGPFIYYECEYLMPVLIILFNYIALILLCKAIDKNKNIFWCLSGIFWGLSAITRPDILFFAVLLLGLIFLSFKSLKQAIMLCLGIAIIILPVTLRNYYVGGDFVPISTQGGINFYLGNNYNSNGKTAIALEGKMPSMGFYADNVMTSSVNIAEHEMGRKLKPSEVSNYWFKKGIDFIVKNPLNAAALFFKKMYYFTNAFEIESNKSIYTYKSFSTLLNTLVVYNKGFSFPFGVVAPFALIGIVISLMGKRDINIYINILYIIAGLFSVVAFFVVSRFRIPIVPTLIIFAAYAIYWISDMIQKINAKRVALFILLFILFYSITNSWFMDVNKINYARQYMLFAVAYDKKGIKEGAEKYYKMSIAKDENNSFAYDNLGILYYNDRRYEQAFECFTMAAQTNDQIPEPHNNLGVLYAQSGQYLKALEEFNKAIAIDSNFTQAIKSKMAIDSILNNR